LNRIAWKELPLRKFWKLTEFILQLTVAYERRIVWRLAEAFVIRVFYEADSTLEEAIPARVSKEAERAATWKKSITPRTVFSN
jgi:hypothetical protein